jgi:autotransporter-associated beta strand protein
MVTVMNANANDFGPGSILLEGTLTIAQAADSTLNGALGGGGTLIKAGAGTLTLANNNNGLSTAVQINGGTIKAGAPNSIPTAGAVVAAGGSLNINGQNLITVPVTAAGAGPDGSGAVVNTAAPQPNALANVTLTGNTTFGGSGPWNTDPVLNRGRWDIRGSFSTAGQPFNLTKTGSNQFTLAGATVDAALGDIDVQGGLLALEGATTSLGEPTSNLTVRAGATVSFFDATTAWAKRFVLFGNGVTPSLLNWNGANTVAGPVTLNGHCIIDAVPLDRGTPVSLTLSGAVTGSGSLTKAATDTLVLSGTYTYTGDTTVTAGTLALQGNGAIAGSPNLTVHAGATLDVTASTGGTLTLASSQTLKGAGTINGALVASAGSTLSPGLSLGVLTVNGEVALQGVTFMELNATLHTNDVLRASSLEIGGTLQLANLTGDLAAGDSFKLFDAAFYNGGFTSVTPATPGPGLSWDLSTLSSDGTLRIAGPQGPQIVASSLSGGNFNFNGTGGAPNGTYYVLSSTNVTTPVMNWTRILTNNFDVNGNFSVSTPVQPNTPQRFFLLQEP